MGDTYEILVIKYAKMANRIRTISPVGGEDHPGPLDYFFWVIRNSERTIVVDTGFDEAEGKRRGRGFIRSPAGTLATLGIDPAAIEDVVITHLHSDHAGTLSAFPKAKFHLQAAEMAYATGPCMCREHMRSPFTAEHVCEMVRNVYSGRVEFYDGDAQFAAGITLHKIGGHSRGLAGAARGHEERASRPGLRRLALLRKFRDRPPLPDPRRYGGDAERLRNP
jgi:glyoxylase-like metal-dependent hydrolase (beta-lactamase superfamily II)